MTKYKRVAEKIVPLRIMIEPEFKEKLILASKKSYCNLSTFIRISSLEKADKILNEEEQR